MRIYGSLLKLLISCIGVFISVTAEIPEVNFNGLLFPILISGQYNGISKYSGALSQREIFESASDSFIKQSPNGTFQLVGTTSYNGTINALCILPRSKGEIDVYIGGNFSTIGDTKVNNIARYDPNAGTFSPLVEGLDGPVYSLYCDTTNSIVYVGGIFAAPVNLANNADFAGSVALWRNEAWEALPFKGFNGPVYTIAYNEPNNTIYFGGQFEATGDGKFGEISNSQRINIQNATITGGNNADREGFGDPNVVVCSADPDGPGTTWLMRDNIPGFWRAEFSVRVAPSMIGIKNTNVEGRGTKTFRLIATADMSVVTLSYMDPLNGLIECSSCPLTTDNVDFQMFTLVGRTELTGIQIDILEWYGAGGGFHGIQLFQSDIIVHAASDIEPACTADIFQPKVTLEGAWAPKLISGIWRKVLQTTGDLATAKATLEPYIPQAGYYRVTMITPSCIPLDCSLTTSVDVTIYPAPGQESGITILQNNPTLADKPDIIFPSVFIAATTISFQPSVVIKASATAAAGAIITVDNIKFEKLYSSPPIEGLFQYQPSSNSIWGGFNGGILAPLSIVRDIKVLSQSSIVISGKFNNGTFNNIVEYDGTRFIPFPKGGLDGRVNTLEKVGDYLLVGGLFKNNVFEPQTVALNNIAKLSLTERQWYSVADGVNGEVEKIILLNSRQVYVTGKFNTIITPQANAEGIIFGNVTFGYAIWDDSLSNWETASFVDGNIKDIAISGEQLPSTFYAGRILSAQSTTAFGGSLFTSSGISALPLYPQALNGQIPEIIINTGSFWNNTKNEIHVIIGGKFALDNNITNIAIMRNSLWNNLGNDVFLREVKYLLVVDNLLYIGSVSVATEESSFVIYDLNEDRVNVSPQLTADDNNVRVNAIKNSKGAPEVFVGGKFDKAGSLECKTICIWDSNLKQWRSLSTKENLSGEIFSMDIIGKNKDLFVAGNLTLNGNPVYLLKYDPSKSSWEDMRGTKDGKLPGPATVVFNSPTDGQFFVAGYAEDGSAYLHKWTGDKFENIGKRIMPDSKIEALSLIPGFDQFLLLVSGSLNLDSIGDVSAALYDGKDIYPYLLSSQTSGVPGRIFDIFTYIVPGLSFGKLPEPVVIIISVVMALFLVFLIFASGMSIRYYQRKNQAKEQLTPIGQRDSVKTPIRDSELLATINAATAIIGQSNNRYSMTSSSNLRNSAIVSNTDAEETAAPPAPPVS